MNQQEEQEKSSEFFLKNPLPLRFFKKVLGLEKEKLKDEPEP